MVQNRQHQQRYNKYSVDFCQCECVILCEAAILHAFVCDVHFVRLLFWFFAPHSFLLSPNCLLRP